MLEFFLQYLIILYIFYRYIFLSCFIFYYYTYIYYKFCVLHLSFSILYDFSLTLFELDQLVEDKRERKYPRQLVCSDLVNVGILSAFCLFYILTFNRITCTHEFPVKSAFSSFTCLSLLIPHKIFNKQRSLIVSSF